jgi:AmiR/NasT family two-component response regulator
MALDYARQIDQLQQAVQSRQLIGQAVGLVMERYDLKDANAFAVLTRLSSERNIKLRAVAEEIVADKNREGR